MTIRSLAMGLVLLLGACATGPDPRLLLGEARPLPAAAPSVVRSVEVREISLPYYAEGEEVSVLSEAGTVAWLDGLLWADLPPRGLTVRLAELLGRALPGAAVAAEPWPLLTRAEIAVSVQASRLLAVPGGGFSFEGQYFIVAEDRGTFERARPFDLDVPLVIEGPAGIAEAHARALEGLAVLIAQDLSEVTPADLGRRSR